MARLVKTIYENCVIPDLIQAVFALQTTGVKLDAMRGGELFRSDVSTTEITHVRGYLQTLGSEKLSICR